MIVGGQALLQKDLHDPLRPVAIPEFGTFSLLTGRFLFPRSTIQSRARCPSLRALTSPFQPGQAGPPPSDFCGESLCLGVGRTRFLYRTFPVRPALE